MAQVQSSVTEEVSPKRGRGRPRKYPRDDDPMDKTSTRPRGRPTKSVADTSSSSFSSSTTSPQLMMPTSFRDLAHTTTGPSGRKQRKRKYSRVIPSDSDSSPSDNDDDDAPLAMSSSKASGSTSKSGDNDQNVVNTFTRRIVPPPRRTSTPQSLVSTSLKSTTTTSKANIDPTPSSATSTIPLPAMPPPPAAPSTSSASSGALVDPAIKRWQEWPDVYRIPFRSLHDSKEQCIHLARAVCYSQGGYGDWSRKTTYHYQHVTCSRTEHCPWTIEIRPIQDIDEEGSRITAWRCVLLDGEHDHSDTGNDSRTEPVAKKAKSGPIKATVVPATAPKASTPNGKVKVTIKGKVRPQTSQSSKYSTKARRPPPSIQPATKARVPVDEDDSSDLTEESSSDDSDSESDAASSWSDGSDSDEAESSDTSSDDDDDDDDGPSQRSNSKDVKASVPTTTAKKRRASALEDDTVEPERRKGTVEPERKKGMAKPSVFNCRRPKTTNADSTEVAGAKKRTEEDVDGDKSTTSTGADVDKPTKSTSEDVDKPNAATNVAKPSKRSEATTVKKPQPNKKQKVAKVEMGGGHTKRCVHPLNAPARLDSPTVLSSSINTSSTTSSERLAAMPASDELCDLLKTRARLVPCVSDRLSMPQKSQSQPQGRGAEDGPPKRQARPFFVFEEAKRSVTVHRPKTETKDDGVNGISVAKQAAVAVDHCEKVTNSKKDNSDMTHCKEGNTDTTVVEDTTMADDLPVLDQSLDVVVNFKAAEDPPAGWNEHGPVPPPPPPTTSHGSSHTVMPEAATTTHKADDDVFMPLSSEWKPKGSCDEEENEDDTISLWSEDELEDQELEEAEACGRVMHARASPRTIAKCLGPATAVGVAVAVGT
ncbi:unnamed protein product [Sympodiomycopsis kandeliae]